MKYIASIVVLVLILSIGIAFKANAALTDTSACMQTAIGARDTALLAAHQEAANKHFAALTTRMNALKSAWEIENKQERKSAIQSAWATYKSTMHNVKAEVKSKRTSIWSTFKQSRIACGVQADGNGSLSDL